MKFNFFVEYENGKELCIHGYLNQKTAFEYYEEAVALRYTNVRWYGKEDI